MKREKPSGGKKEESVRLFRRSEIAFFFLFFSGMSTGLGSGLKFSLIFLDCDCGFGGDEQRSFKFERCQPESCPTCRNLLRCKCV